MKKPLLLIATALFAVGCTQKSDYECRFTLNGETHLTFNFTNVDTPKSFKFFYDQSFPSDIHRYFFSVEHDTIIEYTLPLNHPAEVRCGCDDMGFIMFIVQNEPLTVNVNLTNRTFSFEGFTKAICDYLTEHPTDLFEDYSSGDFAKIDKVYQQKQKDLKSAFAAGKLPKWFFDLETENLLFANTFYKKISQPLQTNLKNYGKSRLFESVNIFGYQIMHKYCLYTATRNSIQQYTNQQAGTCISIARKTIWTL
ncbi:MAG: hypothetical protein IKP62_05215 [Salinivirgaceae bacterium]|nr:hypothetical protein [Salinivirgaceae bacterium]